MAFTVLSNSGAEHTVVDSAGTSRNFTAFWVSGWPDIQNEEVDVTSIADVARRNLLGLQNASMRVTYIFDGSGTASPWWVLSRRLGQATAQNIVFYPQGTASTMPILTFPVKVSALTPPGAVGERLTLECVYTIDGSRTLGTV
mgnify:CR=1 FL=1